MYAAADKYDIPDLKYLAHEKLRSRLRLEPFPWHDFHINVHEVVQSTPAGDMLLRETLLQICVEAVEEITGVTRENGISAEDWAPVLKEDPDFLLAILQRAARANICAAEKKGKHHRQEVAELKITHTREKNEMQARINNLKEHYQPPKRPNTAMSGFASRALSSRPITSHASLSSMGSLSSDS